MTEMKNGRQRGASSNSIGPMLLTALGVQVDGCRRAAIYMEAGLALTITAEYEAGMEIDQDTGEIRTAVRKYSLVEEDHDVSAPTGLAAIPDADTRPASGAEVPSEEAPCQD